MAKKPLKTRTEKLAKSVAQTMSKKGGGSYIDDLPPVNMDLAVSTGSLVLDLTISGRTMPWGGVPGGIIVEIFGPSGSGKTAVLAEMCGSAQIKNWRADIQDPEARFNKEYAKIYGVDVNPQIYSRPNTVTEVFDRIRSSPVSDNNSIDVFGVDSLAALSTELELEKGDKMGMRRAKEFSESLRKICRTIRNNNWLIACTNQVRTGEYGETTPGGVAIAFYSSLRLRVFPNKEHKIIKEKEAFGKKHKKIVGIKSNVYVAKSSIDDPYRECAIYIIFGYGIHDIMTNLQYLKEATGSTMYPAVDMEYKSLDQAVAHIEKNNFERELREEVRKVWSEIENKFKVERKPKVRF